MIPTFELMPKTIEEFDEIRSRSDRHVNRNSRFPDWPFLLPRGYASIFEDVVVLGSRFEPVLRTLADDFGDSLISLLGVTPSPDPSYRGYGYFPALQLPVIEIENYGKHLFWESGERPASPLALTLGVWSIFGDSGAWSIWGQGDWEIAVLLSTTPNRPWSRSNVNFLDADGVLEDILPPRGWGGPNDDAELESFSRNLRMRGSG